MGGESLYVGLDVHERICCGISIDAALEAWINPCSRQRRVFQSSNEPTRRLEDLDQTVVHLSFLGAPESSKLIS